MYLLLLRIWMSFIWREKWLFVGVPKSGGGAQDAGRKSVNVSLGYWNSKRTVTATVLCVLAEYEACFCKINLRKISTCLASLHFCFICHCLLLSIASGQSTSLGKNASFFHKVIWWHWGVGVWASRSGLPKGGHWCSIPVTVGVLSTLKCKYYLTQMVV